MRMYSLVNKRLSIPSDRLSIVANMSAYAIRVNWKSAQEAGLDIATCLFAQALLNGDMSLILAYRRFLDPQSTARRLSFEMLKDETLTTALLPSDCISGYGSGLLRCRVVRLSIESSGIRTSGHVWAKRYCIDFPALLRQYCSSSVNLSSPETRHSDCLESAKTILRGLRLDAGNDRAALALMAAMFSRLHRYLFCYDSKTGRSSPLEYINAYQGTMFGQDQHEKLEQLLNEMFPERYHTNCPLASILQTRRTFVYTMYEAAEDHNPMIFWNDSAIPAPAALFSPTRVLMDGEGVPESLLIWAIRVLPEGSTCALELDDHLPRKIEGGENDTADATDFDPWDSEGKLFGVHDWDRQHSFCRVIVPKRDWSSLISQNTGRSFLLKFDNLQS